MEFEPGHLYHVYNRGNNSQKLFFTPANYLFFLKKIKTNILPYADILAWCLMPNHFHLMIHVNKVTSELVTPELVTISSHLLSKTSERGFTEQLTISGHQLSKTSGLGFTEQVTENSHQLRHTPTLNASIGNILSSYTRAIQKQETRTGSLFQHRTKASCLTRMDGISPSWFQSAFGALINVSFPEKEYPQVCFDYIHGNPVKDGLVKQPEEWEFSSARDYAGLRNGKLINKNRVKEFGLEYFAE
jgi:putative transposase